MDEFQAKVFLANSSRRLFRRSAPRLNLFNSRAYADKSNEECSRCGKKGHFQKECPIIKTSTPSYPSSSKHVTKSSENDDYKIRFYKLKTQMALLEEAKPKEKWLVAEVHDCDLSDESEGEEDKHILCYMAITDDEPLNKAQVATS